MEATGINNIWQSYNYKAIGITKILYSVTNLSIPDGLIKKVNSVLHSFLWGKTEKVKRDVLSKPKTKGGIKMINFENLVNAVKAAWVVRLVQSTDHDIWNVVAKSYLKYHIQENFVFKLNCSGKCSFSLFSHMPVFYKEVIQAFNKAKCITKEVFIKTIFDQPIWGNDHVNVMFQGHNTVLYFDRWITSGLLKIGNLRFIIGILDEQFIYNWVGNKTDIISGQ